MTSNPFHHKVFGMAFNAETSPKLAGRLAWFIRSNDRTTTRRGLWLSVALTIGTLATSLLAQGPFVQGNTQPNPVQANPSGLPHQMTDDTLAQAVQRMELATSIHDMSAVPMHLRYELRMVDYKGGEHSGTYETWNGKDASRIEIHTDSYNFSGVSKDGQIWVVENGLRPLRVKEFTQARLISLDAMMSTMMQGAQKLQTKKIDDAARLCAGENPRGSICFDPSTGYIVLEIKAEQKFEYDGWKQVGPLHLASLVRVSSGKHLLFEATLKEASDLVAAEAFAAPAGATPQPGSARMIDPDVVFARENNHRILSRGMVPMRTFADTGGEAQIRVWVDEKGKVTKAEVEDADNKSMADVALAKAKDSLYEPDLENGRYVSFETTYELHMGGSVAMGFPMGSPAMGGPIPMRPGIP